MTPSSRVDSDTSFLKHNFTFYSQTYCRYNLCRYLLQPQENKTQNRTRCILGSCMMTTLSEFPLLSECVLWPNFFLQLLCQVYGTAFIRRAQTVRRHTQPFRWLVLGQRLSFNSNMHLHKVSQNLSCFKEKAFRKLWESIWVKWITIWARLTLTLI